MCTVIWMKYSLSAALSFSGVGTASVLSRDALSSSSSTSFSRRLVMRLCNKINNFDYVHNIQHFALNNVKLRKIQMRWANNVILYTKISNKLPLSLAMFLWRWWWRSLPLAAFLGLARRFSSRDQIIHWQTQLVDLEEIHRVNMHIALIFNLPLLKSCFYSFMMDSLKQIKRNWPTDKYVVLLENAFSDYKQAK